MKNWKRIKSYPPYTRDAKAKFSLEKCTLSKCDQADSYENKCSYCTLTSKDQKIKLYSNTTFITVHNDMQMNL